MKVQRNAMDDFTNRILERQSDIEAHGHYQVSVSCKCGSKTITQISEEDWRKSDAPAAGRTKTLTRNTCPQCAPDEFGEDDED